jgi:predicted RNA polymerase sigma factor
MPSGLQSIAADFDQLNSREKANSDGHSTAAGSRHAGYRRAISLASNNSERRFPERRLREVSENV